MIDSFNFSSGHILCRTSAPVGAALILARDRRLGIEVNLHHAGPGFILPGNIEDLGGAFNELDLSSCNLTGRVLFLSHTFCLSL